MSRPREVIARTAALLVVTVTLALGVTKLEDSDAFTHLALGREMSLQGGFLTTEPFSYPAEGAPFWNHEWLFALVLYGAYAAAGVAGVVLFKAAIVGGVFWILWRDSRPRGDAEPDRPLFLAIRGTVLLGALVLARPRFVERPDIALMLFLAFTIYALNAWVASERRLLYALPLVAVLWTNTHPSLIVALVPFVAVLAGGVALNVLDRWGGVPAPDTPAPRRLAMVAVVLAAFVAACAINPYGIQALTLPFRLAEAQWLRHEVHELQPPTFAHEPGVYAFAALLVLSLALAWRARPIVPALMALPFLFLGLSAKRFVCLLAVVGAPILARALCAVAGRLRQAWAEHTATAGALATAVAVLVLLVLGMAQVGPLAISRLVVGVGLNERTVPEGALRYLDRNGIDGRLLNTFHWGGYIAWRDFPRRAPIIDGRAWVPAGVVEQLHFARAYPDVMERLQARYGFDVAVVDYPAFAGEAIEDVLGHDVDYGMTSPQWALVYWDDVAMVYVRRTARLARLLERDGYRHVRPANGTPHLRRLLADRDRAPAVLAELDRAVAATGAEAATMLRGYAALELGRLDEAIALLEGVRHERWRLQAWEGLAAAHLQKRDLGRVVDYYRRMADVHETGVTLYRLGLAHLERGDTRAAVRVLERARRASPTLVPVYASLVDVYRRTGDTARAQALGPDFLKAVTWQKAEEHVRRSMELQRAGRHQEAIGELRAALVADPTHAKALSFLGYAYLYEGRLDEALAQQQAALRADPRFGRAHYGLALVYQRKGDEPAARHHLAEYVRLEPRSYTAWQARQQLATLRR